MSDVLVEQRGPLGILTLNRPAALNALTHGMVRALARALDEWEGDDGVQTVVIAGAGERGLCAGGDVVALYRAATQGDHDAAAAFWADEYRLNARLSGYAKPIVAIQDGIVLGGGIGVSAHCTHRIVTERSRLGLPETGIGFVPDVGATWLLSRAPGQTGVAIAMSGQSVDAGDAVALGLSDAYVPAGELDRLVGLLERHDASTAVARVAAEPPAGAVSTARDWIDEVFAGDDAAAVIARLQDAGDPAARIREGIARSSPTAVAVTLAALRRSASLGRLRDALTQEYRTSLHALAAPDFAEGVRAQLIDKDRNPSWQPPRLDLVSPDDVAAYFAPLPGGDLVFPKEEQ